MSKNIFQRQVVPDKPKVLANERIYVYMPSAAGGKKGLASFNDRDFSTVDGHVSLKWPTELLVETLADPTVRPSLTKVLPDEFVKTGTQVTLTHPVTGVQYKSNTAEIRLNRNLRDAQAKPDLIMVGDDFEAVVVDGPNGAKYNKYNIKRKNPLATPSLIQVDPNDFVRSNDIVSVKWPQAHLGGYGLVKVTSGTTSHLKFSATNELEVDLPLVRTTLMPHMSAKPTYGETNPLNWPTMNDFVDPATGLAKRNANGNTLINITKQAVGLSKVENIAFNERTYDQFGQPMKDYFNTEFAKKLDQSKWDGPAGLFRDWAPPTDDRNTVQRWFMRLEEEDNSIWSSIRTLNLFLGYYSDEATLNMVHAPNGTLLGASAHNMDTNSLWAIEVITTGRYQFIYRDNTGLATITGQVNGNRALNLNTGEEHVWNGLIWMPDGTHPEQFRWHDTGEATPNFYNYVETDAASLQPNAPVANVSVGISGKWIQSDHVHPSDPSKLDAWLIEDATIDVTTEAPSNGDFQVQLAKVTVLNSELSVIEASIVTTPQYLSSVPDPVVGQLAIARNNGQIFEYNGADWHYTNEVGSITYNTQRTLNIPYTRTSQYLHNWKNSPTMFVQDENSNEAFWAGTAEEYANLNLADLPNNTTILISDGDPLDPGYFATVEQLELAGVTLSEEGVPSTEKIVTIDTMDTLEDGQLVTVETLPEIPGTRTQRKRLKPYSFGSLETTSPQDFRMAITKPGPNDTMVIGHKRFLSNLMVTTNTHGNLTETIFSADEVVLVEAPLTTGRLVKSDGDRSIVDWSTGAFENRPLVSTGTGDVKVMTLIEDRLIKVTSSGGMANTDWIEQNLVKTASGGEQVDLSTGRLLLSGDNNTVTTWNDSSAENALIVKGGVGGIKVRTHGAVNRILVTDADGKVKEIGAGVAGQILASGGENAPGWVNAQTAATHLPQTVFTSNPTELQANAFPGLVAVILSTAPNTADLRNNCIYYY